MPLISNAQRARNRKVVAKIADTTANVFANLDLSAGRTTPDMVGMTDGEWKLVRIADQLVTVWAEWLDENQVLAEAAEETYAERAAVEAAPQPPVVDLMAALEESLKRAKADRGQS
jgi:hypothetical protein